MQSGRPEESETDVFDDLMMIELLGEAHVQVRSNHECHAHGPHGRMYKKTS